MFIFGIVHMNETEKMKLQLEMIKETAEMISMQPCGSLWNFGTTPTPIDKATFSGRKEVADDILAIFNMFEKM